MGKSAPSPPATPDPNAIAQAQGSANTQTALVQALLNQVGSSGPTGSTTYNQTGTQYVGPGGVVGYTPGVGANPGNVPVQAYDGSGNVIPADQLAAYSGPIYSSSGTYTNGSGSSFLASNPIDPATGQPSTSRYAGTTAVPQFTQTFTPSPAEAKIQQGSLDVGGKLVDLAGTAANTAQNTLGTPFQLPTSPAIVSNVSAPGSITSSVNPSNIALATAASAGGAPTVGSVDANGIPLQSSINAPNLVGGDVNIDPSQFRGQADNAAAAAFNSQYGFLAPTQDLAQKRLDAQLSASGFNPSDVGYTNAEAELHNSQNQENAALAAQATGIGNQEQIALQNLALQGQGQAVTEAINKGAFTNAANSQGFTQNLSNADLANAIQSQLFGQSATNAGITNSAEGQKFGENLSSANLQNAAQAQGFQEGTSNAQLSNSANAQTVANAITQANEPLSQIAALLGTGQVQVPVGNTPAPLTQVQPTDVTGAYNIAQNAAQQNYATQAGLQGQNMAGLAGLTGTAVMAAALYF